jgi:tetratricopeptide (TPR) repeat protein
MHFRFGVNLALNPNDANVLVNAGWVLTANGRAEEAVSLMERGFRLNPFPPDYYYCGLGDSLLSANRVEEALRAQRTCVEHLPDWVIGRLGLTATAVAAGNLEEARVHAKAALKINPRLTAEDNAYVRGIGVPEERARTVEAFRQAGLK